MPRDTSPAPSLKDWFDESRYRRLASQLSALHPAFDSRAFLRHTLVGLEDRSLMERLRRTSEAVDRSLPLDYRAALGVLRRLAPDIDHGFVTLFLSDFVALRGLDDFETSMEALKFFTPFGSAEFAIRPFLRDDLSRTLAVMRTWATDPDPHVRRLASEGCRPRLPWSFRLEALVADPGPALPILETLRADPSPYVRKSVANHLNDITKDHPGRVLSLLSSWDQGDPATASITRHALRTLVKRGHRGALDLLGAGQNPEVSVEAFTAIPKRIRLGERIRLQLALRSTSSRTQRLVVDYLIHYPKARGGTSEKVFKWKELNLKAGDPVMLEKTQVVRDFTTRRHYPGRHFLEVQINGIRMGKTDFLLMTER